jgi:hypothetical protein
LSDLTKQRSQLYTADCRDDVAAGIELVIWVIGQTTVVTIHPDKNNVSGAWLDNATRMDVVAWAKEKTKNRYNIYFTPNEPRCGLAKKPRKSDIIRLRAAAFADVDAKAGRTLDDARATLGRVPEPSLVIASGGGYQPIWLFRNPISVTPDAIERSERLSSCIKRITAGDDVGNIDRLLRLPYSMNFPNKRKRDEGRVPVPSGLLRMEAKP